jgi:hypothetical protein
VNCSIMKNSKITIREAFSCIPDHLHERKASLETQHPNNEYLIRKENWIQVIKYVFCLDYSFTYFEKHQKPNISFTKSSFPSPCFRPHIIGNNIRALIALSRLKFRPPEKQNFEVRDGRDGEISPPFRDLHVDAAQDAP